MLRDQTSRLGDVYRGLEKQLDAAAIAAELGVSTSGFVANYRSTLALILDGVVPRSLNIAKQAAGAARSLLRDTHLSNEAQAFLRDAERRASDHASTLANRPTTPRSAASATRNETRSGATQRPARKVLELLEDLVDRIDREVGLDALEYRGLLHVNDRTGATERLLCRNGASQTFSDLVRARRTDLTLESIVDRHAGDFTPVVVSAARDRLAYYEGRSRR